MPLARDIAGEERLAQLVFIRGAVLPERFAKGPGVRPAFQMPDGILNNQGGDALGMRDGQAEAHRTTVVLQVQRVAGDAELVEELRDTGCQVVKSIRERVRGWRIAMTEAGVVWSDQVILACQARHQGREHP
jgi:hypothetical protein